MSAKAIISCLCLATICFIIPSCKKDSSDPGTTQPAIALTDQQILDKVLSLPSTPFNYANPAMPSYLTTVGMQSIDNTPSNNPVTNEGATLGRVLFYDKQLSVNRVTACASCHKQANGFADPVQFSTGFANAKTTRNAMSLTNARYYQLGSFFWDQRAATLEQQVLMPIQNSVEMGFTLDELEVRLNKQDYYKILFKRAFGDTVINRNRVSLALAQFIRSMVSYQSKFDEGMQQGQTQTGGFFNFTAEENNGMHVFQNNCGRCHGTPVHTASQPRDNGLDLVYTDNGVGAITNNPADNGKFKTPSLSNIAVTAPYMHDGRFSDLYKVVKFYNDSIQNHVNLDQSLRTLPPNGQPLRMNLTQTQQNDLVTFLNTLTDNQFLTDVKFSDPFKK